MLERGDGASVSMPDLPIWLTGSSPGIGLLLLRPSIVARVKVGVGSGKIMGK